MECIRAEGNWLGERDEGENSIYPREISASRRLEEMFLKRDLID